MMKEAIRRKRILVITDDANLQRSMILILRRSGWDALGVSSGMGALHRLWHDRANNETFDLIVADVDLQGSSATSFIDSIQHWGIFIPFALIISNENRNPFKALREKGCRFYLDKPFTSQALVSNIMAAFNQDRNYLPLKANGAA